MKRTYNRTMMISDLTTAKVKVIIFENDKYTAESSAELGEVKEVEYKGLTSWDIIEGDEEAAEIEASTDETSVDEHHEYLVLHFNDGTQATFRNSHTELFIW